MPLPESGGATGSGGEVTVPPNLVETAEPERGRGSVYLNGGERGMPEAELETMSEVSFATAASQGYRTEDDEETHTFEASMVQLGWQNDELISDRWVKIEDQPSVRVMNLVKQEEDPIPKRTRRLRRYDVKKRRRSWSTV